MKIIITKSHYKFLLESRGGHNRLTQEDFISAAQEAHKNPDGTPKYDYSLVDFKNTSTKVKVICPKHKDDMVKQFGVNYFEVYPNTHVQGKGVCPFENKRKERKYSDEDMKSAAANVRSKTEFETKFPNEYYSARQRNKSLPGFYEEITKHFTGVNKYYGPEEIDKILKNNNIDFVREKTFNDCHNSKEGKFCRKLPFDFFIPSLNTLIEFDGEQHFKPSNKFGMDKFIKGQQYDKIKNDYCKNNNLNLIRISYKINYNNLESELIKSLNNKGITLLGSGYK